MHRIRPSGHRCAQIAEDYDYRKRRDRTKMRMITLDRDITRENSSTYRKNHAREGSSTGKSRDNICW